MNYPEALGITHYPSYGYNQVQRPHLPWSRDRIHLTDDLGIQRDVTVERIPPWYMPGNVLGFTNGIDRVVMRNDLDLIAYRGDAFVLAHERAHIEAPPGLKRNEALMDARAMRKLGLSYRPI